MVLRWEEGFPFAAPIDEKGERAGEERRMAYGGITGPQGGAHLLRRQRMVYGRWRPAPQPVGTNCAGNVDAASERATTAQAQVCAKPPQLRRSPDLRRRFNSPGCAAARDHGGARSRIQAAGVMRQGPMVATRAKAEST